MRLIILLFLYFIFMSSSWAVINNGYVPVAKTTTPTATFQQGSIYDTGTSSGAGNVGIGSANPGATLDVNGSVRATSFIGQGSSQWVTSGNNISYSLGNVGIGTFYSYNIGTVPVISANVYTNPMSTNYWFANSGGSDTTGTANIASGYQSMLDNTTGAENTAYGEFSLRSNVSGGENSAFGVDSLDTGTGQWNSSFGTAAEESISSGSYNSGFGALSLQGNAGNNNTAIGYTAGSTFGTNNSIFIGYNSQALNGDTNESVIGYNATGEGSNTITLGGPGVTDTYIPYGNLSIGTTAPYNSHSTLSIQGNIGIGTMTQDSYLINSPPNGGAIIYGNVGIGTWVPNQGLLQVGASSAVGKMICFGTNNCLGTCSTAASCTSTCTCTCACKTS